MPSMKSEAPISQSSPNALKAFFLASRPKTWIASISPVVIGTSMCAKFEISILLATLLFSLFIQIGTNFANDYFDFINGADSKLRQGPKRATAEGWIKPKLMYAAMWAAFGLAFCFGFPLMMISGTWSIFLALLCVVCGIFYTGGPKPLGYIGLGEFFVFIFFGPIATCGAYFLQTGLVTLPVFIASIAPGFLSCAILIANNLRDEISDRAAQKKTLVVRWGQKFGNMEYTFSILCAALVPITLVVFFNASPFLILSSLISLNAFSHRNLAKSAFLLFIYTILFSCISTITN